MKTMIKENAAHHNLLLAYQAYNLNKGTLGRFMRPGLAERLVDLDGSAAELLGSAANTGRLQASEERLGRADCTTRDTVNRLNAGIKCQYGSARPTCLESLGRPRLGDTAGTEVVGHSAQASHRQAPRRGDPAAAAHCGGACGDAHCGACARAGGFQWNRAGHLQRATHGGAGTPSVGASLERCHPDRPARSRLRATAPA